MSGFGGAQHEVADGGERRREPGLVGGERRDEPIRIPGMRRRLRCQPRHVRRAERVRELEDAFGSRAATVHENAATGAVPRAGPSTMTGWPWWGPGLRSVRSTKSSGSLNASLHVRLAGVRHAPRGLRSLTSRDAAAILALAILFRGHLRRRGDALDDAPRHPGPRADPSDLRNAGAEHRHRLERRRRLGAPRAACRRSTRRPRLVCRRFRREEPICRASRGAKGRFRSGTFSRTTRS